MVISDKVSLIWIKYRIKLSDKTMSSTLKYDSFHEKNFEVMYQSVRKQIIGNYGIDLVQLVVYCSHNLVEVLRLTNSDMTERLLENTRNAGVHCKEFNDVREISFEVIVDTFPKKTVTVFPSKIVLSAQIR